MNPGYFALAAYARTVREQIALGNLELALGDLALRAEAIKNDPLAFSRIFGSATLDILCAELGAAVFEGVESSRDAHRISSGAHAVYVCTETLNSGGHARVVSDLIRAAPEYTHHVVLTNLWERPQLFTEEFESLGAQIAVLPTAPILEKLRLLTKFLDRFEQARVFLLNHHQDSVAVAAVGATARHERFFIHHCDYQFCLGLFLPGVVHVDLHTMGFDDCRSSLKIGTNIYWPLTCDDGDTIRSGAFLADGRLVTCCCGSGHKFTGRYPIDYFDTVAPILKTRPGKHIHIGPIEDPHMRRLSESLAAAGVSPDRFQHIPHVPNLREALLEFEVDAYMVSFPLGGGRALIEAMSAGVPVIGHLHHHNNILGGTDLLPKNAPVWSTVQELLAILQSQDQHTLAALSAASRERYENFHHPRLLARALAGELLPLPPRRASDIEPMQVFLFEKSYLAPLPQTFALAEVSWRQ
ncbi:hypothetical protein [Undibacterium sp.]|uniref:hypothetical protein n=1 Tax=Undibacterium sp. TaxID=1914977 RepID=UPI002BDD0DA0|nr:hypothetical protein [Undibacterium sp.]HTD06784.1 hypothetical protein [Undibacterium sp.]